VVFGVGLGVGEAAPRLGLGAGLLGASGEENPADAVKKTPANTKHMMAGDDIGKTMGKLHAVAKSLQHPECCVKWWPGSSRSVDFFFERLGIFTGLIDQ
jgi:hypothetical protein